MSEEPRLPRPGDLVLGYPPTREAPDRPGPYARPLLILEVKSSEAIDGARRTLSITYADGRKDNLERRYPGEFSVGDPQAAGLKTGRKYDLARPREIPWDKGFLVFGRTGPVIGRLAENDLDRARGAHARAQARFGNLPDLDGLAPEPPRAGDVVYLYSPHHDAPNKPGPKPRPCVVTAVRKTTRRDGRAQFLVQYAPGTSKWLFRNRPGDMNVEDAAEYRSMGLNGPGKFKFGDEKVVPWGQGYVCFQGNGPKLGRCDSHMLDRVRKARAEAREGAGERAPDRRAVPRSDRALEAEA